MTEGYVLDNCDQKQMTEGHVLDGCDQTPSILFPYGLSLLSED